MSKIWNILTSEYPPQPGGISDFSGVLARVLSEAGMAVRIWAPSTEPGFTSREGEGALTTQKEPIIVERIPEPFTPEGQRRLDLRLAEQEERRRWLIQYVPNAFGMRGANVGMCRWLARRRKLGDDVGILFHEPYFYFGWKQPQRNLLAIVQRYMAWTLLQGARTVYVSTPTWKRYLAPYAPRKGCSFVWLPFPATLPTVTDPHSVSQLKAELCGGSGSPIVGHFGTYGADIATPLRAVVPQMLASDPRLTFLAVGRNSDIFTEMVRSQNPGLGSRIKASGQVSEADASRFIQTCDLMLQPYPDGVTTRRTSMINLLSHSLPVVTTHGPLTEPLWLQCGGVSFGNPAILSKLAKAATDLLADPSVLGTMRREAGKFYEAHFGETRLADALAGQV